MNGYEFYQKRTHLSVSSLVNFARCPRKYFLSSGCRLGKEEHIALKFGEAIHASLPEAFHQDLSASMASFSRVWGDTVGDDKRNTINARLILADYAAGHDKNRSIYKLTPPPGGVVRIQECLSEWEVPFVLDIGLSVPLLGRVDCLCRHRDTGDYWGLEWKTSSEMSTRFFDGFTFNPQLCAYTLALRSYGIDVKGMMVEALKVSSAKTKAQECLIQPFFISDDMIEDFLIWARWVGSQILACEERQEFPKDMSACTPYSQFGMPGYQCEYLPACLVKDWTSMKDMYSTREERKFTPLTLTKEGVPI